MEKKINRLDLIKLVKKSNNELGKVGFGFRNKRTVPWIVFVVVFLFAVVIGFTFAFDKTSTIKLDKSSVVKEIIEEAFNPSPTPFEFQEMTLPYLQDQKFESQFEKTEEISENSSYEIYKVGYRSDGFLVNGMLTVPKADVPLGGWPGIIFLHGYIPPASYNTLTNYSSYVDYFASRGFVVFKPDLRGHAQSEGEAGGGYYSADYVIDTLNAFSALSRLEYVNAGRIGLWGHSMAGNIVMRTLVVEPSIKAAVIWGGAVYTYTDMAEYGISDNSYRPPDPDTQRAKKRARFRELYGDFDANNAFWKQVVPTNYLELLTTPIQIHHAVDDNVVSIEYSRNLRKILSDAGKEVGLFEYNSGGHNLVGSSFNRAMEGSIEFFKEKL